MATKRLYLLSQWIKTNDENLSLHPCYFSGLQVVGLVSYQHASDCKKPAKWTVRLNNLACFTFQTWFHLPGRWGLYHNTINDTHLHLSILIKICLKFRWYFFFHFSFFPIFLHFMLGTLEPTFFFSKKKKKKKKTCQNTKLLLLC
jgi:hypothetical protein